MIVTYTFAYKNTNGSLFLSQLSVLCSQVPPKKSTMEPLMVIILKAFVIDVRDWFFCAVWTWALCLKSWISFWELLLKASLKAKTIYAFWNKCSLHWPRSSAFSALMELHSCSVWWIAPTPPVSIGWFCLLVGSEVWYSSSFCNKDETEIFLQARECYSGWRSKPVFQLGTKGDAFVNFAGSVMVLWMHFEVNYMTAALETLEQRSLWERSTLKS